MKFQPLGRILGFEFNLSQVMFVLVILISWYFLYFHLQPAAIPSDEQTSPVQTSPTP